MKNFILKINKKINSFILTLVGSGILMLISSILIVWNDFFLRLILGLTIIILAYVLFYGAYKINSFKKEINKYFKIFK